VASTRRRGCAEVKKKQKTPSMKKLLILQHTEIIHVPATVEIQVDGSFILLKGLFGQVSLDTAHYDAKGMYGLRLGMLETGAHSLVITTKKTRSKCFLKGFCALVRSYMEGVTRGFLVHLECVGVGYKVQVVENELIFRLGFSHVVRCAIPPDMKMFTPKATQLSVFGIDQNRVTQIVAQLRAIKPPEPYKGKGLRLKHEVVRRKEGKKK
jgi:large subunit ribosomal protein L6